MNELRMKTTKNKKSWYAVLLMLALFVSMAVCLPKSQKPIQYVDRVTGQMKTETVAGEKWLAWLYYNPAGRATLWTLAKRKFISSIYGHWMDGTTSAQKIQPFIHDLDIDMSIVKDHDFNTFNEFFTRKLKENVRPIDTSQTTVVSPADGKILAYTNISNTDFIIKGYRFNVSAFLDNPQLAQKYKDGILLAIRLSPADYHRFHFPLDGNVSPTQKIDGDYYSVNPLALRKKAEIFCLNKREYTIISNRHFGNVIMAEVGATMVGSIVQTFEGSYARKGEEKGYFKFGGSTVVLLFERNRIIIDKDILINSSKGYETTVKMGERIGMKQ